MLFRSDEGTFQSPRPQRRRGRFDGDGHLFRLAAEARRIQLAHLFDPTSRSSSSQVDPLPHQIQAVYGEMLPRQPLRFLLADDPGAGKTIMAGLYIKELMLRGDVERCLIVAPGSLVDAVAGRAVRQVRPALRHPHPRHASRRRRPATSFAERDRC